MSELSAALGTAGAPHQITHEGKTYSFRLIDQGCKDRLQKHLWQRAREAVYADRDHMTEQQYIERLKEVAQRWEDNEYAFTGERAQRQLKTPSGMMLLLTMISGETEESLAPLFLARGPEVHLLLNAVMEESFRGPKRAPADG